MVLPPSLALPVMFRIQLMPTLQLFSWVGSPVVSSLLSFLFSYAFSRTGGVLHLVLFRLIINIDPFSPGLRFFASTFLRVSP